VDVILPVAAFWIILPAVLWSGRRLDAGLDVPGRWARIALACGLGGFVLHNMVTYSLWAPATGLAFWVAAGASLGASQRGPVRPVRSAGKALAVLLVLGTILCLIVLVRPVIDRTSFAKRAFHAVADDPRAVAMYAACAAQADPLDAVSAADAAMAFRYVAGPGRRTDDLQQALWWAQRAIRRDPANYAYWQLAGSIAADLGRSGGPDGSLHYLARAVQLNPQGMRIRIAYAEQLLAAGRAGECVEQIEAALATNAALVPNSVERLRARQLRRAMQLKQRALRMTSGG